MNKKQQLQQLFKATKECDLTSVKRIIEKYNINPNYTDWDNDYVCKFYYLLIIIRG